MPPLFRWIFFFKKVILYVLVVSIHICVCTSHVCLGTCEGQKMLDSLELELKMAVSLQVGAGRVDSAQLALNPPLISIRTILHIQGWEVHYGYL